ncbi:hypothetical protein AC579_1894 [Pseudocercospora musae]|uniref:Uncharacterized protein n=1 Tax=Pseudocercospora musae TaxID=113226 RepID=A0A139I2A8_9PEZI|nr:hypothetical protein AC579_1894 [Pseudocercospora musae]
MPDNDKGVTGAVTAVTGTVGAGIGGLSRTGTEMKPEKSSSLPFGYLLIAVGGVVGALGRGVGDTINNTTGTKAVGQGLQGVTNGIENGATSIAKGVEDGSKGKKMW